MSKRGTERRSRQTQKPRKVLQVKSAVRLKPNDPQKLLERKLWSLWSAETETFWWAVKCRSISPDTPGNAQTQIWKRFRNKGATGRSHAWSLSEGPNLQFIRGDWWRSMSFCRSLHLLCTRKRENTEPIFIFIFILNQPLESWNEENLLWRSITASEVWTTNTSDLLRSAARLQVLVLMTPLEALHNLVFNMLPDVWTFQDSLVHFWIMWQTLKVWLNGFMSGGSLSFVGFLRAQL